MMTRKSRIVTALSFAGFAMIAGFGLGTQADEAQVTPVFSQLLPNVPGKALSAVVVNYAPGGKSGAHHHAGSVFAYVLTGAIRSQISGEAEAKVYRAGESFLEPPGSSHLVSENANSTEPASLIAIFVADPDAKLTLPGGAQ